MHLLDALNADPDLSVIVRPSLDFHFSASPHPGVSTRITELMPQMAELYQPNECEATPVVSQGCFSWQRQVMVQDQAGKFRLIR